MKPFFTKPNSNTVMLHRLLIVYIAISAAGAVASEDHFHAEATFPPYSKEAGGRVEAVRIDASKMDADLRTYALSSTMEQRDDAAKTRTVTEKENQPRIRTGNLMFDGLFALAIDDMLLNSVSEIRDSSYNDGQPIKRDVFQTGEKWLYVWTRDLSYAADLSLAHLDPRRVVNSLLFKTSGFREGVQPPAALPPDSRQIIQDTGSGGSWPVSTDRVSWAVAASTVLDSLSGEARTSFAGQAHAALRGTAEADRLAAFDPRNGLYGGEHSFLDWRTQTYAPWIVTNLSRMSGSKGLSTNVTQYATLRLLARLCEERREASLAARYTRWAEELKESINRHFWIEEAGLYSSLTTSGEDDSAVHKYDMLGIALVILSEIAPEDRARACLANYPHALFGVPVYFPHQPDIYVYHNRAIWPFVTAYALKAAAHVRNPAVADHAIRSLYRGAALNLSNMENLEWLTGKPWFDDGPAINSRRQLWSVAGYLGMVMEAIFGLHIEQDGLRVEPFLTGATRRLLGDSATATLANLKYQGRLLDVVLELPDVDGAEGYFEVQSVRLNGAPVSGPIKVEALRRGEANTITVTFGRPLPGDNRITLVSEVDPKDRFDPRVFSPPAPAITALELRDGHLTLAFAPGKPGADGQPAMHYNIYRDGQAVATKHTSTTWRDPDPAADGWRACYSVETVYSKTGLHSHHSEPVCFEKGAAERIAVSDPRVRSNIRPTPSSDGIALPALRNWGSPSDSLSVSEVKIARPGQYAIRTVYNNHAHTIDSGVTCAVKGAAIKDAKGRTLARGVIQMPNVEAQDGRHPLRTSTEFVTTLEAGTYTLEFSDFFNMSYLSSNSTFAGNGGKSGPMNTAHIAAIEVIALDPATP